MSTYDILERCLIVPKVFKSPLILKAEAQSQLPKKLYRRKKIRGLVQLLQLVTAHGVFRKEPIRSNMAL